MFYIRLMSETMLRTAEEDSGVSLRGVVDVRQKREELLILSESVAVQWNIIGVARTAFSRAVDMLVVDKVSGEWTGIKEAREQWRSSSGATNGTFDQFLRSAGVPLEE